LAFVLVTLSLLLAACGGEDEPAGTDPHMEHEATTAVDPDLAFIDGMIQHHEDAIEMALIVQDTAEHQEIRDLAGEIIAAQQAEIDQMRGWRQDWFGDAPETEGMTEMHEMPGMVMSGEEMERLRQADPPDKEFIDQMIPHHEAAVTMAQALLETTERPELKQLAEAIIEAQQGEIDQMRDWREVWFPS
jgi:uncharacterized protein (DUF305 family)